MTVPTGAQLDRFADLMHELIILHIDMNTLVTSRTKLVADEEAGLRDRIKEWLKKVREIAEEVKPTQFSVGAHNSGLQIQYLEVSPVGNDLLKRA